MIAVTFHAHCRASSQRGILSSQYLTCCCHFFFAESQWSCQKQDPPYLNNKWISCKSDALLWTLWQDILFAILLLRKSISWSHCFVLLSLQPQEVNISTLTVAVIPNKPLFFQTLKWWIGGKDLLLDPSVHCMDVFVVLASISTQSSYRCQKWGRNPRHRCLYSVRPSCVCAQYCHLNISLGFRV